MSEPRGAFLARIRARLIFNIRTGLKRPTILKEIEVPEERTRFLDSPCFWYKVKMPFDATGCFFEVVEDHYEMDIHSHSQIEHFTVISKEGKAIIYTPENKTEVLFMESMIIKKNVSHYAYLEKGTVLFLWWAPAFKKSRWVGDMMK